MKILLTVRAFNPPFTGGVDVYADRLAGSFRRMGHDTVFLALDSAGESQGIGITRGTYAGQTVWRLRFDIDQRPRAVFDQVYDPEMGAAFRQVLVDEQPDLLVILNFYLLSMAAVEEARAIGLPIVHIATDFVPICRRATLIRGDGSVCREGESVKNCASCFVSGRLPGRISAGLLNGLPENTLVRIAAGRSQMGPANPLRVFTPYWSQVETTAARIERIAPLRRAIDLVLTPTRFTRDMFRAHGFDPERVRLLPFGVEPENPLSGLVKQRAGGLHFVFIGRLQPYKGVHVLVDAFNRLERPADARLSVYGKQDGYERYFDSLMETVRRNGQIQFKGSIPPDRLHEVFAAADAFILPSVWHENTPLILLDALQSGTPVIASDIGGVRDSIRDGENGFLFPMGDAGALAEVLQRCIDHPDWLADMRPDADLPTIDDYAAALLEMIDLQ